MAIEIAPLTPVFAGRMTGIDARRPLTSEEVAAVEGHGAQWLVVNSIEVMRAWKRSS